MIRDGRLVRTAVIDAGIAIGWIQGRARSRARVEKLFDACRDGGLRLVISVVNLEEVLIHTRDLARATGLYPIALIN